MTLLLLAVLASAPLSIRVLERERPTSLHLEGASITCDGTAVANAVDIRAGALELEVGSKTCVEVVAQEPSLSLRGGEFKRKYGGALHLTLEGSGLKLVNEVDVEAYLPSVVEAEASGAKPAALRAQAIVSRTFALASRRRHGAAGFDLCDLAHCQLYRGALEASEPARQAVSATRDRVLLSGSVALKATFFHSSCGGHTSRAQEVFGQEGGSEAVSDVEDGVARCHESADFVWEFSLERAKLAQALGYPEEGNALEVLRRDEGGRIIEVRAFNHRLSALEFLSKLGKALGWAQVKSAKFSTEEVEGLVRFTGHGRGHGVGLCQQGAQWLAERGVDAEGILQRYFPGARLAPAP